MKQRSPVYSVTSHSETVKRPKKSSKIYTALRGPSTNESTFTLTSNDKSELVKKCYFEWFDDEPLFLYAGRRRCIEQEISSETGRLFVERYEYRNPELADINKGLRKTLEKNCRTTGRGILIEKLENKQK